MTETSLRTSIGDFALHEYRLALGGKSWSFLHTGVIVTWENEQAFFAQPEEQRLPYGAILWPASIALAHELVSRADELKGKRVLELGAGTGIPGIVAESLGASVVQIDRSEVAVHLCQVNAQRNDSKRLTVLKEEWDTFHSEEKFDFILGADVLYVTTMHDRLRAMCSQYLAPSGSALFSDPFREQSLPMLEALEQQDAFRVSLAKWSVTVAQGQRSIAVYEARRA